MSEMLRLAIQKSGRLSDESLSLLSECGIRLSTNQRDSKLKSSGLNFPLEVFYVRDDDIPGFVESGLADIGIVGENVVLESGRTLTLVERLGFSKCRLSIAVPKEFQYESLKDLEGLHIATSYPKLLSKFITAQSLRVQIREMSGSVEIGPALGIAQAICDLVSSGSTLAANGLREIQVVMHSEAVLVRCPEISSEKTKILESLCFRIHAHDRAQKSKYVVLNAPNVALEKIIALLPGIKSPTIVPLAMQGWSAVHSVLPEDVFWERIESLKAAGAEGILVVAIEKMIA